MTALPSTVPECCSDLENILPPQRESLLRALACQLRTSIRAADQDLGHLEEQLLRGGHELFRQMLEKAAQEKAAAAPPLCPHCQNKLRRLTEGHGTTIQTAGAISASSGPAATVGAAKSGAFPPTPSWACPTRAPNLPACRKSPR